MKTICLKTEDQTKYLSVYLLKDSYEVNLTETGTGLNNAETQENVFVLDLKTNNAKVFENLTDAPADWSPRNYYYYPNLNQWEKLPEIIVSPLPDLNIESENFDTDSNDDTVT